MPYSLEMAHLSVFEPLQCTDSGALLSYLGSTMSTDE